MSTIIFGIFDKCEQAESAIETIEARAEGEVNAVIHHGRLRDEDVQMGATDLIAGATLGAVVVGVLGATLGVLLTQAAGLSLGWVEWVFIGAAGTIMGITAGAVAGASEPQRELKAMGDRLADGQVLVTIDTADVPSTRALEMFRTAGALEVQAA